MDSWWHRLSERLRERVPLSDYYLAFVLLNLGDLLMTGLYFRLGGYEANRLAARVLHAFGTRGLPLYKFALITVVIAACEALHPRHPKLSRGLILAGCALYAAVIALQVRGLALMACDALMP